MSKGKGTDLLSLLLVGCATTMLGYYAGKVELYESLYSDKIECKLTRDSFVEDLPLDG